jgi:hypothetical protein
MPKLAFDYPKRVLHIGPYARLALLSYSLTLQEAIHLFPAQYGPRQRFGVVTHHREVG